MPPIGLYIHVPFCASICSYCNFNRGLLDTDLKTRYVDAVEREIHAVASRANSGRHPVTGGPLSGRSHPIAADTIYFGGGTPSLLEPAEIERLIDACRTAFALAPDSEITLEANPETVTPERMAGYLEAGVNRASIGVQSFADEELRRLGRVHDAARARKAFADAREAGFDNISLDLMLWLPQQSVDACMFSVMSLVDVAPEHASLYLLELYPNSPLKEEMARAGWSLAPDEDAAEMYERAIDVLARAGYAQYEISNFARPGFESRHNLKYWTDGEWLAFGCGAHSTMDGVRWKNVSATDVYVRAVAEQAGFAVADERRLGPAECFGEALFMGLRLARGLDLEEIHERYGVDVWHDYGERLAPFVEAGLLVHEPGRLALTVRGFLLSNEVMTVFIEDRVR